MGDYSDVGEHFLDTESRNTKVIICGDRNWVDVEAIRSYLCYLQEWNYDTIITGGARGADTIAKNEAEKMDFHVITINADWAKYGKVAGPIRNRQMLDFNPDLVIYFHDNLKSSLGTKNMVVLSLEKGVTVINGSKNIELFDCH